jgi:two-component system nitrate/nitrite response regulator NarL
LDKLNEKEIDVVLLDLEMPILNGIETLKVLKNQNSPVKVIMLTTHNDLDIAFELLSMGVNAYLLKESSIKEMVEAITTVYEKGNYTNKIMNDAVINSVATERKIKNRMFHLELSERELFVLKLICDGYTSKFIAGKILTSKKTVDYIRTQIMKKFDAKTSNELMRLSIINGLYTPRSNEEIMSEKENAVFALKIKTESKILHKSKKTK